MAVRTVKADDVANATEIGVKWFAKQGVEIDPASIRSKDIKINGRPAFGITLSGKDKDGQAEVSITLVGAKVPTKFLFIYSWGSPEGAKANLEALVKLGDGIKATKYAVRLTSGCAWGRLPKLSARHHAHVSD